MTTIFKMKTLRYTEKDSKLLIKQNIIYFNETKFNRGKWNSFETYTKMLLCLLDAFFSFKLFWMFSHVTLFEKIKKIVFATKSLKLTFANGFLSEIKLSLKI